MISTGHGTKGIVRSAKEPELSSRVGETFQPYREGNHIPLLDGLIPLAAVKSRVRVQPDGKLEG